MGGGRTARNLQRSERRVLPGFTAWPSLDAWGALPGVLRPRRSAGSGPPQSSPGHPLALSAITSATRPVLDMRWEEGSQSQTAPGQGGLVGRARALSRAGIAGRMLSAQPPQDGPRTHPQELTASCCRTRHQVGAVQEALFSESCSHSETESSDGLFTGMGSRRRVQLWLPGGTVRGQ